MKTLKNIKNKYINCYMYIEQNLYKTIRHIITFRPNLKSISSFSEFHNKSCMSKIATLYLFIFLNDRFNSLYNSLI